MAISRRDALRISGSTLAGLSVGALAQEHLQAQAAQAPQAPWPDQLVERPLRAGIDLWPSRLRIVAPVELRG